jgi:metal-dependent HD superfamily phosphatase/phosphodiesterase
MTDTNIFYSDKDLGKKLYRKKTYYTLVIEQEVLADDQDQADRLLSECGIDHSAVTDGLAETKDGVETVIVDANYHDSGKTEYVGKVVYTDDDYAKENGDVEIDTYAPETEEVA